MRRRARRNEYEEYYQNEGGQQPAQAAPSRSMLPHFVLLLAVFGGALAAVHYFAGAAAFGQLLLALATPVGTIWVLLFIGSYWSMACRIRLATLCCGFAWLLLTLAGNGWIASQAVATLERPFLKNDPRQTEPVDALLVLGGGTDSTPAGVPQLAASGDRLTMAARLYHTGQTEKIIVSGVRLHRGEGEMELFQESAIILQELGVPLDDIVVLETGRDTSEELDALREWLTTGVTGGNRFTNREFEKRADEDNQDEATEQDDASSENAPDNELGELGSADETEESPSPAAQIDSNRRIGVISSAWHLPRVIQLADVKQVTVVPIPSDFLTESFRLSPAGMVPNAKNLWTMQLVAKEFLAKYLDQ